MIYFDSTYVARVYLSEPGSAEVRALVTVQPEVACCEPGKIELLSVFHRKLREGALDTAQHLSVCRQFEEDLRRNVWFWLPVSTALLEETRRAFAALPATVFLRAVDALHLVCARANGLPEIYSNDRHLLAAAPHCGVVGRNVIPGAPATPRKRR